MSWAVLIWDMTGALNYIRFLCNGLTSSDWEKFCRRRLFTSGSAFSFLVKIHLLITFWRVLKEIKGTDKSLSWFRYWKLGNLSRLSSKYFAPNHLRHLGHWSLHGTLYLDLIKKICHIYHPLSKHNRPLDVELLHLEKFLIANWTHFSLIPGQTHWCKKKSVTL